MGSFSDLWASECGSVITVQRGEQTVVWLLGEIDASLEPDLALIALLAPRVSSELVIDAAWMTFADCTLTGFVAKVAEQLDVTARRPSVLLLDLLRISGLLDRVKVDLSLSGAAVVRP